jgi:methyl-accepting chemotaxis protein
VSHSQTHIHNATALMGDRLMLAAVALSAMAAAVIGYFYCEFMFGLIGGLALAGLAGAAYLFARDTVG